MHPAFEELFAEPEGRLIHDDQKEATPNNLTRYGFDASDTLHVTVYDAGEAVAAFTVGSVEQTPSGDQRTWIRPDDSDSLYRVNRDLRSVLDKDLADWRNRDVLSLEREERDAIDAVEVAYAGRELRLEKSVDEEGESAWHMVEPVDIETDPNLLSRWIRDLGRLRAADFADGVELAETGLTEPEHVVTVHLGDEISYRLQFGLAFTSTIDDSEQRYVRLDDGPVFTVSTRDAERFMKRTGDFRPRQMVDVESDTIRQIAVVDRGGFEMLVVRNELPEDAEEDAEVTWRMEAPEEIDSVDMDEMRRMITALADIEAMRFDDDISPEDAAFDNPRRTLTATLDDGSEIVLALGRHVDHLGEGDDEASHDHYARVDGGNIFVLRAFKVRNLLKSLEDLRSEVGEE